jgi:hypothetical protein
LSTAEEVHYKKNSKKGGLYQPFEKRNFIWKRLFKVSSKKNVLWLNNFVSEKEQSVFLDV